MFSHELTAQVEALREAGMLRTEVTTDEAVKVLADKYWADRIALIWSLDDVRTQANEMGLTLSDDRAQEVLQKLLNDHDAGIGVNWDIIGQACIAVAGKLRDL